MAYDFPFEILYVGQAYGKVGERMAMDRLKDHGTLQKIYYDHSEKYSDRDIWLLLMSFDYGRFNGTYHYSVDDSVNSQAINIIEGALINYFKPKYNVQLKDNFPNKSHLSYNSFYSSGYNMLKVVCTLEHSQRDYGICVGTKNVKYAKSHMIDYSLQKTNDMNLLDLAMGVRLTKPLFGL